VLVEEKKRTELIHNQNGHTGREFSWGRRVREIRGAGRETSKKKARTKEGGIEGPFPLGTAKEGETLLRS